MEADLRVQITGIDLTKDRRRVVAVSDNLDNYFITLFRISGLFVTLKRNISI